MSFAPETAPLAKPEALLRVPVGLASPLWGLFAGAAMSGAAWWWMTRWARPQNLEAMFGAAEASLTPEPTAVTTPVLDAAKVAEPLVESIIEPMVDAVGEAALEVAPEQAIAPFVEAVIEAAPEPVAESVEPVVVAGGQADVALAAAEEAKPKKKAPAPKAD